MDQSTRTMHFTDALRTLRDNVPVRRLAWHAEAPSLVALEEVEGLSVTSMLAEDWVAVPQEVRS